LSILVLAYLQNVSFSIVSRARNRNSWKYHLFAAAGSNTIWFLTFRQLVLAEMSFLLFVPYTVGTVVGSLTGAWLSMRVERWLGATSDDHVRR
jgi:uncharacterized membrane protein YfcA